MSPSLNYLSLKTQDCVLNVLINYCFHLQCWGFPFHMSEGSKCVVASAEHNKVGPNYFGFYVREVAELLSQDKDFLPCSSQASELSARTGGQVRDGDKIKHGCDGKEAKSSSSSGSLFSNGIGAGISDFKNERLKALLRQSVTSLTQEVDEVN